MHVFPCAISFSLWKSGGLNTRSTSVTDSFKILYLFSSIYTSNVIQMHKRNACRFTPNTSQRSFSKPWSLNINQRATTGVAYCRPPPARPACWADPWAQAWPPPPWRRAASITGFMTLTSGRDARRPHGPGGGPPGRSVLSQLLDPAPTGPSGGGETQG